MQHAMHLIRTVDNEVARVFALRQVDKYFQAQLDQVHMGLAAIALQYEIVKNVERAGLGECYAALLG